MSKYTDIQVVCNHNINDFKLKGRVFNSVGNFIAYLYERYLIFKLKKVSTIRLELQEKNSPHKTGVFSPSKLSPQIFIRHYFDFDNYFAQSKQYRRKIILETLYDAIKEMCQKMNLDLLPFTIAYEKVKELNYENKFIYGKLTSSPNRKYKAGIEIEIIEEKAILSAVLNNGTEKSQTIKFLETLPHQMFIYRLVHKGKWTSKDIYTVSDKSRQINFDILFKDNTSKIRFEPKTATIEDLQKALKSVGI